MATIEDEVMAIFASKGQFAYYGEDVSQLEHALQAANFAEHDRARPSLVVAALLHDIGHLLDDSPDDIADHGVDAKHEKIGKRWLSARFTREVYEPVYLHVEAKRYLCAKEPAYFERLSAASVQSLTLQGGRMNIEEISNFELNEFWRNAVALRRWDDEAKIPGLNTRKLAEYRDLLAAVAKLPADD